MSAPRLVPPDALDGVRLARVLAALTDAPAAWWSHMLAAHGLERLRYHHVFHDHAEARFVASYGPRAGVIARATVRYATEPDAAREALVTAELLPPEWGAGVPWDFFCEECDGSGCSPIPECGPCACNGRGLRAALDTHELVTVAARLPALLAARALLTWSDGATRVDAMRVRRRAHIDADARQTVDRWDNPIGDAAAVTRWAVGAADAAALAAYDLAAGCQEHRSYSDEPWCWRLIVLIPDALPWDP